MISVFLLANNIKSKIPKQKLEAKLPIVQLILHWQKTKDKLTAKLIIDKLKPTLQSALHSFAPGKLLSLLIPAIKLMMLSLAGYDISKGIKPSTFIYNNLQRLNRIRRDRENIIHIPLNQVYEQNLINKKNMLLLDTLGREPSLSLLADATGMNMKRLQKIMDNGSITTINDSSAVSLLSGQSMVGFSNISDKLFVDYVYNSVDPINQKIILWTTPYYGKPSLDGAAIAKKLNITPAAVSQRKAYITDQLAQVRNLL